MFEIHHELGRKPLEGTKHMDIIVDRDPSAIPGLCPCAHPKFSSLSVIESEDRTIWVGSGSKIRIRSFRIENTYAPCVHGPELDLQP
jgi:hypothetical protein